MPLDADQQTPEKILLHCLQSSVLEGRIAAIRWLSSSAWQGIARGNQGRRTIDDHPRSKFTQLEGKQIDLESVEAKVLSKVWKGYSQASDHPTRGTSHPSLDAKTLDEALRIIIRHLENTIYKSGNRKLQDASFAGRPQHQQLRLSS
jgi:hypothetical protein